LKFFVGHQVTQFLLDDKTHMYYNSELHIPICILLLVTDTHVQTDHCPHKIGKLLG